MLEMTFLPVTEEVLSMGLGCLGKEFTGSTVEKGGREWQGAFPTEAECQAPSFPVSQPALRQVRELPLAGVSDVL